MARITGFEIAIILIGINFGLFVVSLCGNWGTNEYGQVWSQQLAGLIEPNWNILGFQVPGIAALAAMIAGVLTIGAVLSKTTGSGIGILAFSGIMWGTYLSAAAVMWMMPWQPMKYFVVFLGVVNLLVFVMDLIDMSSG